MYAAIDVGGSKALVASLDENGVIQQQIRFETPETYEQFLAETKKALAQFGDIDFRAAGAALPGTLDRKHGRIIWLGNLPWKDIPVQADLEDLLSCPVVIENDAKLGALSEAMMVKEEFSRVLYVTVSTGIGFALVVDREIDTNVADAGGATLLVEHRGKLVPWESFASGRAIVKRFGKKAKDIDDVATWRTIVRDLRPGMIEIIAMLQPDVVIIGGSVGQHFDKYGQLLREELAKYETPLLKIPPIRKAARPEEAVIYGCYDLAKARFGAEVPA